MTPQADTFLSTISLPEEELEIHAFDERFIVPTAQVVAAIWTGDNARLRLLRLEPDDLYLLALDQCLSAFASGEGVVAVNRAGQVVALCISCDSVTIGGNENAVVWIDQTAFSPTTRAYKAMMDVLYQPFYLRFQEFLAAEGCAQVRGIVSYGLKGGVDPRYRGHKLLARLIAVNFTIAKLSGFRFYAGIATHPVTTAHHRRRAVEGRTRTLHQARLADFVDPATGQRPYEDAGDLHFVLGVTEYKSVGPDRLDEEGAARLRRWHAKWQQRLPERERRARELVNTLVPRRT